MHLNMQQPLSNKGISGIQKVLWGFDLLVGHSSLKIIREILCLVTLKLGRESESQSAGPQPRMSDGADVG